MLNGRFFTTGETAKIFGISRSTVSRKFDEGIFYGKKNPITGERQISQKSVEEFAKKYSIQVPSPNEKNIVVSLATNDYHLKSMFRRVLTAAAGIECITHNNGYDFIISCAQFPPDMVIIDDSLTDISSVELIKAFNRTLKNKKFSVIGCFSSENRKEEVKNIIDYVFNKELLNEESIRENILPKLKSSHEVDVQNEKYAHKRMWRRISIDLSANIRNSQKEESQTDAYPIPVKIKNISLGGAYLSNINYPQNMINNEKGNMILTTNTGPLVEWEALTKIVRFHSNDQFGVGLKFISLTESNEEKIMNLINQPMID